MCQCKNNTRLYYQNKKMVQTFSILSSTATTKKSFLLLLCFCYIKQQRWSELQEPQENVINGWGSQGNEIFIIIWQYLQIHQIASLCNSEVAVVARWSSRWCCCLTSRRSLHWPSHWAQPFCVNMLSLCMCGFSKK